MKFSITVKFLVDAESVAPADLERLRLATHEAFERAVGSAVGHGVQPETRIVSDPADGEANDQFPLAEVERHRARFDSLKHLSGTTRQGVGRVRRDDRSEGEAR